MNYITVRCRAVPPTSLFTVYLVFPFLRANTKEREKKVNGLVKIGFYETALTKRVVVDPDLVTRDLKVGHAEWIRGN